MNPELPPSSGKNKLTFIEQFKRSRIALTVGATAVVAALSVHPALPKGCQNIRPVPFSASGLGDAFSDLPATNQEEDVANAGYRTAADGAIEAVKNLPSATKNAHETQQMMWGYEHAASVLLPKSGMRVHLFSDTEDIGINVMDFEQLIFLPADYPELLRNPSQRHRAQCIAQRRDQGEYRGVEVSVRLNATGGRFYNFGVRKDGENGFTGLTVPVRTRPGNSPTVLLSPGVEAYQLNSERSLRNVFHEFSHVFDNDLYSQRQYIRINRVEARTEKLEENVMRIIDAKQFGLRPFVLPEALNSALAE